MAITYKSQGAGVATETSGAALSPLCPAVVDAGDILIAHVYWEGTTTAPSTPANWALLHGPEVIQSTIARHWVFGKIAAGTEDGSAVAFGNPAVTTQRGARVYSFAGRVSGTITDLVVGFAATSHGTDPQMPTVTTTTAGGRAVALVAQNDNNTAASATGESGGDWTESVAEFVAALTPGLMMQIQTCIPTADPGTVSGGSVATTNDPCGVIGFEVRPSIPPNPITATPGVLALIAASFAPVVTTTAHMLVTAGLLSLTLTAFAPTITVEPAGVIVVPEPAALTFIEFAPTVATPRLVTPSTFALATTAFAPTATSSRVITPAPAVLSTTAFAPAILSPQQVTPSVAALTTTAFAPTVNVGKTVTVGVLNLGTVGEPVPTVIMTIDGHGGKILRKMSTTVYLEI